MKVKAKKSGRVKSYSFHEVAVLSSPEDLIAAYDNLKQQCMSLKLSPCKPDSLAYKELVSEF